MTMTWLPIIITRGKRVPNRGPTLVGRLLLKYAPILIGYVLVPISQYTQAQNQLQRFRACTSPKKICNNTLDKNNSNGASGTYYLEIINLEYLLL